MDDDLSLAEALGADWGDTPVPRFKEGQCDATESAGGSEADEEQVPQPCLITSDKDALKWAGELTN